MSQSKSAKEKKESSKSGGKGKNSDPPPTPIEPSESAFADVMDGKTKIKVTIDNSSSKEPKEGFYICKNCDKYVPSHIRFCWCVRKERKKNEKRIVNQAKDLFKKKPNYFAPQTYQRQFHQGTFRGRGSFRGGPKGRGGNGGNRGGGGGFSGSGGGGHPPPQQSGVLPKKITVGCVVMDF